MTRKRLDYLHFSPKFVGATGFFLSSNLNYCQKHGQWGLMEDLWYIPPLNVLFTCISINSWSQPKYIVYWCKYNISCGLYILHFWTYNISAVNVQSGVYETRTQVSLIAALYLLHFWTHIRTTGPEWKKLICKNLVYRICQRRGAIFMCPLFTYRKVCLNRIPCSQVARDLVIPSQIIRIFVQDFIW